VAEVFEAVVEWNRLHLGPLADHPLRDPRVEVVIADVATLITTPEQWDLLLLDMDNGPDALTVGFNEQLYRPAGLARQGRALRPGGVLAVWSAAPDRAFLARLNAAGLSARAETVSARGGKKGARHTIFVARRGGR
jgi:spermidine synthase